VQLPIIENLLREIKEKLFPREVVFFISLQMYQLASELQHFFERKPDLAMGRARVDTAWLVRGDCYQYLNRDLRASFKEQYLARFAAYFAGGPSHLTRRAVSNALMNLETKARSSLIKVTALEAALKENQSKDKVASRVLETFGLMRELHIPEPQDYLAAWGHTPVFQRAFRLGFGNYTTTTISLANGFIRQTYLLTPETLTAAGVTSRDQQHILETAGSWVTDFVRNHRIDGVQVDRLFTSLPLKGLSPTTSVEVWNDALRLIYFLYANCLVDAPNREWLLLPEGEFDAAVRCYLRAEDLSDWLSKSKWHEPEDRAIPHKVEERCQKLAARYGERPL
jgi:hypothetical protein